MSFIVCRARLRNARIAWGLLAGFLAGFLPPLARGQGIALLVPAYFSPATGYWNQLAQAAARVPLVAIGNLFNGPGSDTPRADYIQAMRTVRASGGQVVGYVYTQYGNRHASAVKADMLLWHQLYPIDGFFVDEMSNEPSLVQFNYYAELVRYARELRSTYQVIGNPGTNTEEAYLQRQTADILTIFESDRGYATFAPAAWTKRYAPFHFANLPYAVPDAATMTNYLSLAISRGAGFIYVTDDGGTNPWDRLPTYWNEEVARIEALNITAAEQNPPRLSIAPNGRDLLLRADGTPGRRILESSPSLRVWTPIFTNVTATGVQTWTLTNTAAPNLFFRLRQD